jgi:hypothetical protein
LQQRGERGESQQTQQPPEEAPSDRKGKGLDLIAADLLAGEG